MELDPTGCLSERNGGFISSVIMTLIPVERNGERNESYYYHSYHRSTSAAAVAAAIIEGDCE